MQTIKPFRAILTLALILTFFVLFSNPTLAQFSPELSIGHAPTAQYLDLQPGDTYEGEITFWNLSNIKTDYTVIVRGFEQVENYPGTAIILTEEADLKDPYSASSWITPSQEIVALVPNEYVRVTYSITVPLDAANGEHHAKIFLLSRSDETNPFGRTQAISNLGAGPALLINVGDNIIEDAELLSFTSDKKFYELPPVTFITKFGNLGNTHVAPKGDIIITNVFGQEIERILFNENNQSLIRGSTALYEDIWDHDSIFFHNQKLAIGPVHAKLLTTYKTENPGFAPLSATVTFWIIPWKHLLAILVVIFVLYQLVFRRVRGYDRGEKN